uniref:Uncharacterized protein n=1 Tax=viral metagenome TaxID=1070528 RepID=A0A6C0J814_9ZZZZ
MEGISNFDISITQLKMLGIEKLKYLDDKIKYLSEEEQSMINNSTISKVKQNILGKQNIITDLNTLLEDYKSNYYDINDNYEKISLQEETKRKELEKILQEIQNQNISIDNIQETINDCTSKIYQKESEKSDVEQKLKLKQDELASIREKYKEQESIYNETYQNYLEEITMMNEKILEFKKQYLFDFSSISSNLLKLNTKINFEIKDYNDIYNSSLKSHLQNIWCKKSKNFMVFTEYTRFIRPTNQPNRINYYYPYSIVNNNKNNISCNIINIMRTYHYTNKIQDYKRFLNMDIDDNIKKFINFMENDYGTYLINRGYTNNFQPNNVTLENYYGDLSFLEEINKLDLKILSKKDTEIKKTDELAFYYVTNISINSGNTNLNQIHNYIQAFSGSCHELRNLQALTGKYMNESRHHHFNRCFEDYHKPIYDWFKKNYKEFIFVDKFKNTLKDLLEDYNFDELFELFKIDFDIDDFNSIQFIIFINFLGTEGNYYDYFGNKYYFKN